MAQFRCSDEWPYRHDVHEHVECFKDDLVGMDAEQELNSALNEISVRGALLEMARDTMSDLQTELAEANQRISVLKTQLSAADERAVAAENARQEAEQRAVSHMVRAQQLFDENAELKARLERSVQRRQALKKAAPGVEADVQALREERDALRRALHASESRAGALASSTPAEGASAVLRVPQSWSELHAAAAQLKHVRVTSSAVEPALKELAHHVKSANWLERAWVALVALDEFAAAPHGKYPNFKMFCQEQPREKLTEAHVILHEGQTVRMNPRMQAERVFSTEQGPMEMLAHVKIGSGAPPAPRLYFQKVDSVVYVGRIGPHLTNTQTN